ncbi:hypothetical protein IV203_017311 [Nitzschia inconspicua]|uniref:Uncharacterized protein n=1 Tax=Nitzschia inconspicua TaxID=303405 RepID=A0A9K3KS37_9STRA|nr:hypothetical protein IV203_017311 [Nitzschia inconspicua]
MHAESAAAASKHSKVIQDALNILTSPVMSSTNHDSHDRAFFSDTSFFDQAFPFSNDDTARNGELKTLTKQEPVNFFDMNSFDSFPSVVFPTASLKDVSKSKTEPHQLKCREVITSSNGNRCDDETPTKQKATRIRSSSRHQSSSKQRRSASAHRLDRTNHSSSGNTESSRRSCGSTSRNRARSSSKNPSSKREASTNRDGGRRSKSRERTTETVDKQRPERRMLKQSAASRTPSRSRRQKSSSTGATTSKTGVAAQSLVLQAFTEAEDTEHVRTITSSRPETAIVSVPSGEKRPALAKRRAERTSSKGSGNDPPKPPIRSPDKSSPSMRSRKSRSDSATRQRAFNKRNLLGDASSNHTASTAPASFSSINANTDDSANAIFASEVTQHPSSVQARRHFSHPDISHPGPVAKQVSLGNRISSRTSTPGITVATLTGEVTKNSTNIATSSRPRPSLLTRSSPSSENGRPVDATRIDGLLQKLRDPSSRNLLTGNKKPADGTVFIGQSPEIHHKKGQTGMLSRFSRIGNSTCVRLDE